MAQQGGFLNTAPPPIPGGGSNPTGMRMPIPQAPMPNLNPAQVYTPQQAQQGSPSQLFPANTGGSSPTNVQNIDLGVGPNTNQLYGNLYRELTRAYGKGMGATLFGMITNGLFNPQLANALINQMQPMRNRGRNDILNAFGAEGARFSSAGAIGLGDFESQFALNEQATLANMALQDQQMQLQLMESLLPTLHGEEANKSGIFGKILGGLEIAGGIVGAPFTGGASLGMIPSGVSQLTGKGGGGAQPSFAQQFPGMGAATPLSMPSPIMNQSDPNSLWNNYYQQMLEGQAGTIWDSSPTPPMGSELSGTDIPA